MDQHATINRHEFYKSVFNLYKKACIYIINQFPFDDPMLIHAKALILNIQHEMEFSGLEYM